MRINKSTTDNTSVNAQNKWFETTYRSGDKGRDHKHKHRWMSHDVPKPFEETIYVFTFSQFDYKTCISHLRLAVL